MAAFAASEGQGHPRLVELEKTAEGFGFNVMGGREQKCPIYISRIIPGGYSDRYIYSNKRMHVNERMAEFSSRKLNF